jgi:hypothetical protein
MTKKSLNKKEAIKTIENRIQENTPRQEKYKLLNNLLLGLLALTIFVKILIGIVLLSSLSPLLIPIAFALPILTIWFALEVSKYKGYIYNILGLVAISSIFNTIGNIGDSGIYGIIDLVIV